jgi:NADH-ubiquinone oxidoreductase chain 5
LIGDFNESPLNCLNDESWGISKSILGLLIIAIIGGSILNWLIFSSIFIICLPIYIKNSILFVCILGGLLGYLIRNVGFYFFNKSINFYLFSYINISIWFIPILSTLGSMFYPLILGYKTIKSFDQGWSEFIGGQNFYFLIKKFSLINQFLQNNNLKIYLILFVFWVFILVALIFS